ncbi:MAG: hypothetical protein ABS78_09760 [Phenylobacterium sp. SCN 70-31]|nr:MAG: hypothetical protein ABS78_09760 [Phenylobacterium sp. SCN 70-31]
MRLRPLTLGAFAWICIGGVATAQQMPKVDSERQFSGDLSVSAIYDSNFARSSSVRAALRGIKPKEYTLRPQANLNVVQPFGRQVLFLSGSGGYDFHRENPRLDRRRYDVQGGYMASLGMCQAAVVETFRAAQSDLADLDLLEAKNEVRAIGTTVTAACGRPTGLGVSAAVSRIDTKNSAFVQRPADSTLENLSVQLGYANENIGRIGLVYSYADSELPNRIIPGRPVGDGFWTESYGLSVGRDIGSRLTVDAQAARTRVKREFAPPGLNQKFTSTTYAGDVTYRIGSRLSLNLNGERAVRPTMRPGKLYDIATAGQISGQYSLGSRYTVSLGYGVQDVKSNVDTIALRPIITSSRTHTGFGSVRYQQNDRTALILDVRYIDRNTNIPDFNYSSTRVAITAQVGF